MSLLTNETILYHEQVIQADMPSFKMLGDACREMNTVLVFICILAMVAHLKEFFGGHKMGESNGVLVFSADSYGLMVRL